MQPKLARCSDMTAQSKLANDTASCYIREAWEQAIKQRQASRVCRAVIRWKALLKGSCILVCLAKRFAMLAVSWQALWCAARGCVAAEAGAAG